MASSRPISRWTHDCVVRQQAASQFKAALKAAQRRVQEGRWQEALNRESSHILDFLSNSEPVGRGLVIFSCRPDSIWQGGRSQMRFQRHIDFHVTEHLKKVVDELERLAKTSPFALVLGGTDEIVNEILAILPDPIMRRVIGKFPVDYKHDTEEQIFEHAALVWKNREQFAEANLLDQVVEAAKSGRRAVLGIEPTLSALVEEKVRTLLISNGLAIDGCVCTRCDYLSERPFKTCPLCDGEAEQRDVTDRAVEKAILTGAKAIVVSSHETRDRLLAEGGLAALLRY